MAAVGPHTRQLAGVPQGMAVVVERAEQQPPPPLQEFIAGTVTVGEAGAFLALLSLEVEAGVALGGEVRNRGALESVDEAAHLVALFKDYVIPELRREPTRAAHILIVQACARRLRADAVAAGGSFSTQARAFAEMLEAFVAQANAHPLYGPYAALRAAVDDLRRRAGSFLHATCTVRQQALVVAAAAGAAEEIGHAAAAQAAEDAAAAAQEAAAEAEDEED